MVMHRPVELATLARFKMPSDRLLFSLLSKSLLAPPALSPTGRRCGRATSLCGSLSREIRKQGTHPHLAQLHAFRKGHQKCRLCKSCKRGEKSSRGNTPPFRLKSRVSAH